MTGSSGTVDPFLARKQELRAQLRERRRLLDAGTRLQLDAAINRTVVELAEETGARTVAGFRAFDGEPDLAPALEALAGSGRHIVLPVLFERPEGTSLQFHSWRPSRTLRPNRFGIPEPEAGDAVSPRHLDLILMPLVGWDERGGRLGMGAGYYDRALAGISRTERPIRAGIAYSVQRVPEVPTDTHDVPLHVVITECGRFTCPS
jgi:5-formyltetrahydrofolate cyclo-ligase